MRMDPKTLALALGLALGAAAGAAQAQQGPAPGTQATRTESAVFAGGCFWCVESDFDKVPGVLETVSGYAGGHTPNPTYKAVSAGGTGHLEAVRVTYDPSKVSYPQLVAYFWRTVDPLDAGGQFCDRGESYATALFPSDPEQAAEAERAKARIEGVLGKPVATRVVPLSPAAFTPAEGYHQNYHQTNSLKYTYYRYRCGRDARLQELWGEAAGKWPPPDAPAS